MGCSSPSRQHGGAQMRSISGSKSTAIEVTPSHPIHRAAWKVRNLSPCPALVLKTSTQLYLRSRYHAENKKTTQNGSESDENGNPMLNPTYLLSCAFKATRVQTP